MEPKINLHDLVVLANEFIALKKSRGQDDYSAVDEFIGWATIEQKVLME